MDLSKTCAIPCFIGSNGTPSFNSEGSEASIVQNARMPSL
jgi:hypothetical protein